MEKSGRSRRGFIKGLIFAAGWSLLTWRFLVPRAAPKKQAELIVAKADIPAHGALVFPESRLAVIREAGQIYALSLVCTHLGCTVKVTPTELHCPCHGSVFSRRGDVQQGPADRPLERLQVEERGQSLAVLR